MASPDWEAIESVTRLVTGAVFTIATGHGLAVDDAVLISSGWGLIDNLVARVSAQTASSLAIAVINSTDENFFAIGSGIGSLRKVSAWTEIPQVTEVAQSGWDQQYTQIKFLSDDRQRNLAAAKSQTSRWLTIHPCRYMACSQLPIAPVIRCLCACIFQRLKRCVTGQVSRHSNHSRQLL